MTEIGLQNLKQQKSNDRICKSNMKDIKKERRNHTIVKEKKKNKNESRARLLVYRKSIQH